MMKMLHLCEKKEVKRVCRRKVAFIMTSSRDYFLFVNSQNALGFLITFVGAFDLARLLWFFFMVAFSLYLTENCLNINLFFFNCGNICWSLYLTDLENVRS